VQRRAFTILELMTVLTVIAILATLSYPYYLDYKVRSFIVEAMSVARTYQTSIERYYLANSRFPAANANSSINLGADGSCFSVQPCSFGLVNPSRYISNVFIGTQTGETTQDLAITFSTDPNLGDAAGKTLLLRVSLDGDRLEWTCYRSNTDVPILASNHSPRNCELEP